MKRILAIGLLAATPLTAEAAWGFTSHMGIEHTPDGLHYSRAHQLPSFDIKNKQMNFQIDLLETIESLMQDDMMHLGVNFNYTTIKGQLNDTTNWQGIVAPGVSFDYSQYGEDLSYIDLIANIRMGAQTSAKDFGFGVYVVPGLGLSAATGDGAEFMHEDETQLAVGGALQVSIWKK